MGSHIMSLCVSLEFLNWRILEVFYIVPRVAVASYKLGKQESQIFSISGADLLYQ